MASVTTGRRQGVVADSARKVPVKAATTANITLEGEQTINSISCVTDDRVLVKDQTDASENGIYIVDTSTWTRAPDWDGSLDVVQGTFVYVNQGTNRGHWRVSTSDPITIGTTSVSLVSSDGETNLKEDLASTAAGDGAALVAIEDSAGNFDSTTVEGALAEIWTDLASTSLGLGAAKVGVEDSGGDFTGTTVEAVLAEIAQIYSTANGEGASQIGIEDSGGFFSGADVEFALKTIAQHIISAQKFIPISIHLLRETVDFDVGNTASNAGILASDTTPVLEGINDATDGCQRLLWAAGNVNQVTFQTPLPPDLNTGADLVIHFRIVSGGTTDAVGFTVDSFFNEGDTKITDTSGTNQTTTYSEVTATIASADIPTGAQTITVGLTPVAHTTDTLALTAVWIEYTGSFRAA